MSQYCYLMFVFKLTGPMLFAVNICFAATESPVFNRKMYVICFRLLLNIIALQYLQP